MRAARSCILWTLSAKDAHMPPQKEYEVLEAFETAGEQHEVGAVISLIDKDAGPFVESGKVKLKEE